MSSVISESPDPDFEVERFSSLYAGTSTAPSSPPTHALECDFQSVGVSPMRSEYEITKEEALEDRKPLTMDETVSGFNITGQ